MSKKISERVTWVGKIDWELVFSMGTNFPHFGDPRIIPI